MLNRDLRALGRTRTARSAFLAALAAATIGAAAPRAAAAPADELHVAVHAPLGKGCISGDKLKVAVQKHVGSGAHRTSVDVRIATNDPDPGWAAEVAVAGRAGTRVVRTQSTDCRQLDEGLVLVVTLLLDPEENKPAPAPPAKDPAPQGKEKPAPGGSSWGSETPAPADPPAEDPVAPAEDPDPPDEEPGAAQEPPASPAEDEDPNAARRAGDAKKGAPAAEDGDEDAGDAKKKGDDAEKDSKESDEAGKDPKREGDAKRKVQFGIGMGFAYTAGLLPAALPGARLSFSWISPAPFPFEVSYTYNAQWSEYKYTASESSQRQVSSMSFEVQACPLGLTGRWLHLVACGGLATTYLEEDYWYDSVDISSSPEYYGPYQHHQGQLMLSPTAELRADFAILSWLHARAGFGGMVAVNPMTSASSLYTYSDGKLTEPVIFRGQLGIEVVLPP